MGTSVRGYWDHAASYQRFLYAVAATSALSALVHGAVFLADDRPWEGAISWRKPLLFSLSFALVLASLSWVFTFLPRRRLTGWLLCGMLGVASVAEVFLIAMQAWRGTASHFNDETLFDSVVFISMGVLIGFVALAILLLTIWSFFSLQGPTSFRWAIRGGLVLLVAGQAVGGMVLGEGLRQVEFGPVSSPVVLNDAGIPNVPHAAALHGLQVLPFLAWLLSFTAWPEGRRVLIVLLASVGYAALVGVSLVQALGGRAPFDLSGVAAALFWASVALLAGALGTAVLGLRRSPARVAASA